MDTGDVLRLNDSRTTGQQRLYQPTYNVKVYEDSFFPRAIQDWNRLPAAVTDSPTIEEFSKVGRSKPPPVLTSGFNRLKPPWSICQKVVNTSQYEYEWSIENLWPF